MDKIDLQALVVDYLVACGAAVVVRSYALVEALLPEHLAEALGGRPHALLAFDLEVAQENPGAEFITFGHPFLERVLEGCLRMGRTVRRYAVAARLTPPGNLQSRVGSDLQFVGARAVRLLSAQTEEQHAAWFQFRITLEADEKRHQTAGVLVDLHTALPLDHLVPALSRTFWDASPSAVLPSPVTVPLAAAYSAAAAHLERHGLRAALAAFEGELRVHRERELTHLQRYYDGLEADLRRRFERAADAEQRAKLEQKLAATVEDRQRRIQDLVHKFTPQIAAALEAVTWYVWPRVRVRLVVEKRNGQHQVDVWYDLIANSTQPLPCSRCRTWLHRVDLSPQGEPCCPDSCGVPAESAASARAGD